MEKKDFFKIPCQIMWMKIIINTAEELQNFTQYLLLFILF